MTARQASEVGAKQVLGILIKKQLSEVFRSYFYDAKKNRMRSKGAIVGFFIFFVLIMVGMLGGIFTFLAVTICEPLASADMGWMYFLLMSGISIFLGAFGSVFNTYASLYLAKDNDLLLSMPIPVRTIIASRLVNVYIMGTMYAATVMLPTLIVSWIVLGVTAARLICGILLFFIISLIVLLLSAVLGYAVARISLKLKNKSFLTVLISLVFIGAYYFFYFRASDIIRDLIANAAVYGEKIKGTAYLLYLFGRIGEGDWLVTLVTLLITAALCGVVWYLLSRSFLGIAGSGGKTEKVRYVEKPVRMKSLFGAVLSKEFSRFTSNSNYMLNCGLSTLLIPALGVLLLLKGREICLVMDDFLASRPGFTSVLLCTMMCTVAAMNDMATPSVSLEGKSLWIPQTLPLEPKMILRAKACVQLILTGIPMLFASAVSAIIIPAAEIGTRLLIFLLPMAYVLFSALFCLTVGVKMPLLEWTTDTTPIKQSGAILIVLFGGWAISFALAGLYLLIGYRIGETLYLSIWLLLFLAASAFLLHWLDGKGARLFDELAV